MISNTNGLLRPVKKNIKIIHLQFYVAKPAGASLHGTNAWSPKSGAQEADRYVHFW